MANFNNENEFEVRDLRIKEKFFVDDLYLNGYAKKCGIYATGVYLSLCRHANKEQTCWPSYKKMAEELKISIKQVGRSIKILEEQNIIKKIRIAKKLNNRYLLLDKSEWTNSPITKDHQSNHIRTNSPIYSKDTQLNYTNKKEDKKLRPYFRGMQMRKKNEKWYCIPKDGGDWLEFAGKKEDIQWE